MTRKKAVFVVQCILYSLRLSKHKNKPIFSEPRSNVAPPKDPLLILSYCMVKICFNWYLEHRSCSMHQKWWKTEGQFKMFRIKAH